MKINKQFLQLSAVVSLLEVWILEVQGPQKAAAAGQISYGIYLLTPVTILFGLGLLAMQLWIFVSCQQDLQEVCVFMKVRRLSAKEENRAIWQLLSPGLATAYWPNLLILFLAFSWQLLLGLLVYVLLTGLAAWEGMKLRKSWLIILLLILIRLGFCLCLSLG